MAVPSINQIHDQERILWLQSDDTKIFRTNINIKINKTVSIECLFFYMIGPIKYHQAMQTNYHFFYSI